jgi:serine/threonine protein kinase
MTNAYNYERDLLLKCRDLKLDRVVVAIDHGSIQVQPGNAYSSVPYIIFELADGDVRKHIRISQHFDLRWALRTLHHIATGLQQLHRKGIAHQDLKPSNVMMFEQGGSAKLGDLGRASQETDPGRFDHAQFAGDRKYLPPELAYGLHVRDWHERRGADAYHLGNMIVFMFTGMSMTALWVMELAPEHRPRVWKGSFADVLPFVRAAVGVAADKVVAQLPGSVRKPLGDMLRHLCDPDPAVRGHPRARSQRHADPYDISRFVTELDLLARRAEAMLLTHVSAP